MKIRIEVDVKPGELREFLGLPDVTGIQEEALDALTRGLKKGTSGIDPVAVIRSVIPSGLLSPDERQRMLAKALETGEAVTEKRVTRKRATRKKATR